MQALPRPRLSGSRQRSDLTLAATGLTGV